MSTLADNRAPVSPGQDSLARSVAAAGIDVEPVWFDEVASTNAVAMERAAEGAPEWTVIAAGHQTAGRGRQGRSWADAPGRSLLVSVVLRPRVEPERAPLLSLLAATAMVGASGVPAVRSKWPNDVVAGDRKLGGILAEAEVRSGVVAHAVVGVGVNVATEARDFPDDLRDSATSLRAEGGDGDVDALLTRFLAAFRRAHAEAFPDRVVERYAEVCSTLGRRVRATTADGAEVEGTAVELDERGGLVLDTLDGPRVVAFGEVHHLR